MSDWGKIFEWVFKVMDTKAWIILVVTGVLLCLPESLLPKQALDIRENWGGWVLVLLLLSACFTLNGIWKWGKGWLDRRSGNRKALESFENLHPSQQMLLLDLYFGSLGSFLFWINSEAVVELVNDGYITYGMIDFDDKNNAAAELWLTESALELIRSNKSEMQKKRASLASQGERENVKSWIWARR